MHQESHHGAGEEHRLPLRQQDPGAEVLTSMTPSRAVVLEFQSTYLFTPGL